MLTRRGFAGFASCAICAATGFIATDASAQGASDGVTRTTLSQMDGPTPGYYTLIMQVELAPNASLPRHTHPGIESGYVAEGGVEVTIKGQAAVAVKAGGAWQVAPETPHALKNGDKPTKYAITYTVEKGKPLISPAPE
jgi:quercetin dioxygenase-like cupin family protein